MPNTAEISSYDGRICTLDPQAPSWQTWPELVPAEPEAVLDDCVILDGAQLEAPVLVAARTRHAMGDYLGGIRRLWSLVVAGACAGVICSSPALDMVRYEQFGLGRLWTEECGTATGPDQSPWLLSYSPYHRVRAGVAYPAVLFTCPDVDPRVGAMHVRKMTAALQHASTGPHPVLIRREADVGHTLGSTSTGLVLGADTLGLRFGLYRAGPGQ